MKERKWFAFAPDGKTWLAFLMGFVVIGISGMMRLQFSETHLWFSIFLRDFLMIFGVGFVFVILIIEHAEGLNYYGITKKRLGLNLGINVVLAVALFFVMKSALGEVRLGFSGDEFFQIIYILIAGAFECLFFYSFLRVIFEKSFGKILAAILCAGFYSFHHWGFQPEFLKLFFVGLSFVIVVILTDSIFSIYPFYWAVGGVLDVLVQSEVVSTLSMPITRVILLLILLVLFFTWYIFLYRE